jgi:hypothetical protein
LAEAESTARDAIATWLDVPAGTFDVTVSPDLPDETLAEIASVRSMQRQVDEAVARSAELRRKVARDLVACHLPVRDVGTILGISPQRVSQLTGAGRDNRR